MLVEVAPMAGYTDAAFRKILSDCGAKVVWTEMVSAAALFYNQKGGKGLQKTLEILKTEPSSGVKTVVQLFGKDPKHFEYAINFLNENGFLKSGENGFFSEININMGCPANKILKNGEGVALMQKPELVREIIEACVCVSPVPISVKMRLDNVMEIAKICEQSGVSRIIIHARFGKQGYSGKANWKAIADIVRMVSIPVIANGDIRDQKSAVECIKITGASGLMVGRVLLKYKYFDINCKQYVCNEKGLRDFWHSNFDMC